VIPVRKLFFLLVSIAVFLLLMHFCSGKAPSTLHDRFDLDAEANIPTWYSTVLLFAISMSSLLIYRLSPADRPSRDFWLVFSFAYGYFSLDEAARFHEIIDQALKWVYIYAPLFGAFFALCVRHFRKVERPSLRNWILGGLMAYALGGLGGELVSHLFNPLPYVLQQSEFVFEEGLEMLGAILVLAGCWTEINRLSDPGTTKRAWP
jgi:hypothetical protein